jgi:hypothetical protein
MKLAATSHSVLVRAGIALLFLMNLETFPFASTELHSQRVGKLYMAM